MNTEMRSGTDTLNEIAQQGAKFSLISIVLTGLFYCIAALY
ncbi:hypothetical protein [Zhongshania sp.]|jgi:hypothetical protein|nr:hypothetical protein [Zhongshania sp.]